MLVDEFTVEVVALEWFGELGYAIGHGLDLASGEPAAERDSFGDVVLVRRLREAVARLNPAIPDEAREDALRKVLRPESPGLVGINRRFHRMLRDGIPVEYVQPEPSPQPSPTGRGRSVAEGEGLRRWGVVRLIDFDDPGANDWFVVNQFVVVEHGHHRRPDIVVFVNGLPLGVIELKNAADAEATIWDAYRQLQTYRAEIPSLLHYNEVLIVSDGSQARIGSLTANQEWFKVWREIDSDFPPPSPPTPLPEGEGSRRRGEGQQRPQVRHELETLIRGVFAKDRLLKLLLHFIVFEEDTESDRLHKIIAGYHQFHAVNAAVEETVRASGMRFDGTVHHEDGAYWAGRMHGGQAGDRRAGVVWHTQGSGQELLHALLCRADRTARGDAKSDAGTAHRSQRPRRPALRPIPALPRNPRADAYSSG